MVQEAGKSRVVSRKPAKPRHCTPAHRARIERQRDIMDMEELLGLDAGDFDDVDFAASDEEQEEEATAANGSNGSTTAASSPAAAGGAAEASGSSSVSDGVPPAAEGASSSAVTTVVEVGEIPSMSLNLQAILA